jgi:hypothetical protein
MSRLHRIWAAGHATCLNSALVFAVCFIAILTQWGTSILGEQHGHRVHQGHLHGLTSASRPHKASHHAEGPLDQGWQGHARQRDGLPEDREDEESFSWDDLANFPTKGTESWDGLDGMDIEESSLGSGVDPDEGPYGEFSTSVIFHEKGEIAFFLNRQELLSITDKQ